MMLIAPILPVLAVLAAAPRDGVVQGFRSSDGLKLEGAAIPILPSARQPDVVLLPRATPSRNGPDAGTMLCYAVAAGDGGKGFIRSLSLDQGRTWGASQEVRIDGWPADMEGLSVAGPSAIQLADGRLRLYFTTVARDGAGKGGGGGGRPPSGGSDARITRVFSAISNDGLVFAFEDGHRFELAGISDAEVVRLPDPPDRGDDRKIGPWLLFVTRDDSTLLATSRDGLTFARDETFVLPSVRQAAAELMTVPDARWVRLYGRDKTGLVSGVFVPANGEVKLDPGTRRPGEVEDPTVSPTGDGGSLLVFVSKTADKQGRPQEPGRPRSPPPVPEAPPAPKRPLDPKFPPTDPPSPPPSRP